MLEKKPTLIISFERTTDAMAADRWLTEQGLPGRLIPLPGEISAGCGMAWKAAPEDEAVLREALAGSSLSWLGFHLIEH